MNLCMAHGGPDGEGVFIDEGIAFGHRRLSLIDLSEAGKQPMQIQNGVITITFNGEIYNFNTLRNELEALGFTFNSHSDTEVILVAYQAWGTQAFAKLSGMFAFALFDSALAKTFLVRDQAGIKPLYYSTKNNTLVFASEVKAFKQSPIAYTENPDWKVLFMAYGHMPDPFTTLEDVFMLPAETALAWDHQREEIQFFDIEIKADIEVEEQIGQSLTTAVERHLISDAPIGIFLSGGIDSSILTLIANNLKKEQLKTVSINFDDEKFSEEPYQNLVANITDGQHHAYTVTEKEFLTHFDEAMQAMDQPTQDGINSWFVNKYAKVNGLKAVLSGLGADELLGGYPSFKRIKLAKSLEKLPKILIRLLSKIPHTRFERLYYLSYGTATGMYLFLRGAFTPKAISKLSCLPVKQVNAILAKVPQPKNYASKSPLAQCSILETRYFMQQQLLKDTDFMSMAHGVEVRVPFLDRDFISLCQNMPDTVRFPAKPKGLLIDTFKNLLPKAIWDRPKMGFTFPFEKWLNKVGKLIDLRNYSNTQTHPYIKSFTQGKLHWSKLLIIYQVFGGDIPS